jgi:phage portal protein BeeE
VRILAEAVAELPLHRNGKGDVVALYPLMPNKMSVDRDEHGEIYYTYTCSTDEAPTMKGMQVWLNRHDVLHIPGLGFDGLVGYSPIAMAKNAIGMAVILQTKWQNVSRYMAVDYI